MSGGRLAPDTDHLLLSVDQLMDIYCKSAVQGAVMLLNSTPDTTGLISVSHANVYKALGDEIKRRFDHPVKTASGKGYELTISFDEPILINHVVIR